jgi:hypothetical protein
MSYLTAQEFSCPACKHPNDVEVWSAIDVKEDPELKDLLMGGELNMAECESCHEVFYAERFLLYHDRDRELMAFVYPLESRADRGAWEAKTAGDFAESQKGLEPPQRLSYEPLTLFGLDELAEVVERDEESEIQSEIVRLLSTTSRIPVKRLPPDRARRQQLPTVLPVEDVPALSARESLLRGLSKLESVNDRLFVYQRVKQMLLDHPDIQPQF